MTVTLELKSIDFTPNPGEEATFHRTMEIRRLGRRNGNSAAGRESFVWTRTIDQSRLEVEEVSVDYQEEKITYSRSEVLRLT